MPSVLLVEDDGVIARVISTHLRHAGYDVEWVPNGELGLDKLRFGRPDVAVVDLMLPDLDGWALTRDARADGIETPIIAISARGSEHDKVYTLGLGADDYLAKPFGMRELVARVQALLRRRRGLAEAASAGALIVFDGLRIDPDLHSAFVRTAVHDPDPAWVNAQLTPTEFRLLLTLARQSGRAMSRDELQQRVWGIPHRHRDRTVDACIRRIREKVDQRSPTHEYVHTHYGVGYRLAAVLIADAA
jgi:two-component system OmpR family response regulator